MKTLAVALMLIATMLLPVVSMAAPKHAASASKHVPAADAAKSAEDADAPAPEVEDKSLKGQIRATVVAAGGGALATQLHIDPAWLGIIGASLAIVVLLVLLIVLSSWLAHRRRGPAVYAGDYHDSVSPDKALRVEPSVRPVAPRAAQQIARQAAKSKAANAPADFDVPKFLRSANSYFLRLQVAWDRGDLNDIGEFAKKEICDELKTQLKQRGDQPNRTGVEALDAELLKLESGEGMYVASVKFSGMIREENNAAKRFVEVWSLSKPISSAGGWTLAGIQQFE
jgi:predicted lipid-binding transport protein (Tim44 family)